MSHHQHHHHHQQRDYVPPTGLPPPANDPYGFPSTEGRGYAPEYRPAPSPYGPPPGAPPRVNSPYGPPPVPPRMSSPYGAPSGYPGQETHHHHSSQTLAPPSGPPPVPPRSPYAGPPIPPRPGSNYAPPPGPPPTQYGTPGSGTPSYHHYAAPPGPPPSQYGASPVSSSYAPPPGVPPSYGIPSRDGYGGYSGQYAPPPGPPPRPPTGQQQYGPVFQGQDNTQQQPYFQYSQCTGRRKALCIGINYIGTQQELKGCINDANNMRRFLINDYGYDPDDIVMLTDDQRDLRAIPTRQNMIDAFQWLVHDAQPNDSLFLHYSGHGGLTKDLDGDEESGYDEVIYPLDFQVNGQIVDDELHDVVVKPLPPGCRLTAVFDSCHSGSVLDLPYLYTHEGTIKEPNLAAEAAQGLLGAVSSYARGDLLGAFSSVSGLVKEVTGSRGGARERKRQTKTSPADVICWGGCKDQQTSADTFEGGQAVGAMSYAFMTVLRQNKQQSYQQLLVNIRAILYEKYSQKPQLSSSHPMDTNLLFIC